ncbi:RluA family pseudouridine synthase [Tepidibacter hydrothermalis]|uniref:Pseudouridine synthase n=1 Tax=Tepidibacter hydrothermalis TaxID=3036126 RepID=A0ABY8EHV0_9FIRM|nr:RluA family pseudouridine synthase [Tepidibacter hydrothermalis]WFD11354.1 RluA family pseudouridine synthase [Tepidibacter hydrothermalis]
MLDKKNQRYNLISYQVQDEELKLKKVLLDKLNMSVRFINKMKKDRNILVNSKYQTLSYQTKIGDLIEVKIDEESNHFEPQDLDTQVLYEDFDIMMINKPPYMVVHPTKSHKDKTIANGIMFYLKDKKEDPRIRFVNRLDMNTSGLLIVAKNAYAHHLLSQDMNENKITKKYIAIVKGVIKEDFGTIDQPIYRETEDSIKRIVDERGQKSVSHFKVIERLEDATIVEVILETGRTHQIRVHLSHLGYGIIGDELYGYEDESLIKRQALHAYKLEFNQPRTKEKIDFKAEIPDDMKELINKLKGEK